MGRWEMCWQEMCMPGEWLLADMRKKRIAVDHERERGIYTVGWFMVRRG